MELIESENVELVTGSAIETTNTYEILETYLPNCYKEIKEINVQFNLILAVIVLAIAVFLCKMVYKFFNMIF